QLATASTPGSPSAGEVKRDRRDDDAGLPPERAAYAAGDMGMPHLLPGVPNHEFRQHYRQHDVRPEPMQSPEIVCQRADDSAIRGDNHLQGKMAPPPPPCPP